MDGSESGATSGASAVANKAMEGSGFYNRNSNLQAAGIELALPLFEDAAQTVQVDEESQAPLVIADYGSSQGRNSMRPMRLAIETFRKRFGPDRAIEVIHTDLPSNDFTSLFTTLQEDGGSYLAGQSRVFPSAVGRSYFEPILPGGRVHLAWNTWTLHWMSRNPVEVPDHLLAAMSVSKGAREAVRLQQAQDWAAFLAARSAEMAHGAKLVSLSMGRTPEVHGWDWVLGELWKSAVDMADDGLLSPGELLRFTTPAAGRWTDDLKAPFTDGSYCGLTLEHAVVLEAPDPFWDEFIETKDAEQLGRRWAGMLRAVSGPIAATAFASRPNADLLVDELYQRLESRIAVEPQRHQHFIAVAVVRKTGM
jgi:hypothetical protein